MNQTPTRRPSSQIERELDLLQQEIRMADLPNIAALELSVTRWTTEALLDERFKEELRSAHQRLRDARDLHELHAVKQRQVAELQQELENTKLAERLEKVAVADQRLSDAIDAYKASALQTAKAFRALLDQQQRSAQVPGAQHNLSPMRLNGFNIPHLMPMSWNGTLGESMMGGAMPWENGNE